MRSRFVRHPLLSTIVITPEKNGKKRCTGARVPLDRSQLKGDHDFRGRDVDLAKRYLRR